MLNSKLYSFLKDVKASKLAKLFGPRSVSSHSTGSANESNLVFTIPPDLPLSDPERSVLAKGLKFVPNSGPIDLFPVKEDTEAFFRRLRLKAYFYNQSSACSCLTELISSFLDGVMFPLVKTLPSYIKDTKHALQIFDQIRFSGSHKFIFTMDVKSLYTVIPHRDGLEALKFFLNKRTLLEPSTTTLIRLAELILTLNNFSFDGEHYQQISGVAMGTKMGPNYANLFVGYVEQ